MCKLGVISQEQLNIEVKSPLRANRKSYMPRRLARQRMTLSDLELVFHASRAISAVAELLACVECALFAKLENVLYYVTAKNGCCVVFCSVQKNKNFLNYSIDISRSQTNPVARLKYGFEWVNASAAIAVDLDLKDPNTAILLEFLYYT